MGSRPLLLTCALLALSGAAHGAVAPAAPTPAPSPEDGIADRLADLVAEHGSMVSSLAIGSSLRGRTLEALVIRDGEGPLDQRRGLLLVSGLDGRRSADGQLLLDVAERLLGRDDLADVLDGRALVFVPLANPDGASTASGDYRPLRGTAGNRRPDDADRDGRMDEDGPSDLDGDGVVAWMRVPDATGDWVVDEHDPRALRKKKDDERGTHRVMREGRDDDGDGETNEDDDGGVHVDRNFAHGWPEHAPTAGRFPVSEPESRALVDFVLAHPGLEHVLVVGDDDTLVSVPKKAGKVERGGFRGGLRAPLDGLLEDDVKTMEALSALLTDAGGESKHDVKAAGPVDGSLLAWAYHQAGRWALGVRPWSPPEELPKPEKEEGDGDEAADGADPDPAGGRAGEDGASKGKKKKADDAEEDQPTSDKDSPVPAAVLAWLDAERGGEGFLPWTAFDHPELGPVEIGGFLPGVLETTPDDARATLADTLDAFVVSLLAAGPRLAFEDVEVDDHGGGMVTVSAVLVNVGALPTSPKLAADVRSARPIRIRPELPDGAARVHGPPQVLVPYLAGHGGRHELRWTLAGVSSGAVLTLSVDADRVDDLELEVTL
jgi:hypothetical protein